MDKLSKLIQEAKPLYLRKKRQKRILSAVLILSLPIYSLGFMYTNYMQGNSIYLSLKNNSLQTNLLDDEFGLLEKSVGRHN